MPIVIIQNWEERERGWGTRPDGFTVHASIEGRNAYAQWYTTTSGNAFPVDADDAVAAVIAATSNGVVHGRGTWWPAGKRLTVADLKVDVLPVVATPSTHDFSVYYATKAKTTHVRDITTTSPVIRIGRAPGSLIKLDGLAWQHAIISVVGDILTVTDLGGGVSVDGHAVKVAVVKQGATLTFDGCKFRVIVDP